MSLSLLVGIDTESDDQWSLAARERPTFENLHALPALHERFRRHGGRPTVWTAEKLQAAVAMHRGGEHDIATIARVLGVSRASVYRGLAQARNSQR